MPRAVFGLGISPAVLELELEPGETARRQLKLFNETDQEIYLSGVIEIFQPRGEEGQAKILPPEIGNQAVGWLKLPLNSVSLKPGEFVNAPLVFEVPETADVGGYYLAAVWETAAGPKKNISQIEITSRVGALIFLTVAGEVEEKLEIVEFSSSEKGFFGFGRPIEFLVRLENKGNVHLKPRGQIVFKNIFGRPVESLNLNPGGRKILPNSVGRLSTFWPAEAQKASFFGSGLVRELKNFRIGRITAQVQAEYGSASQRFSSQEIVFWVVPWRLLGLAAVVLIIIFGLRFLFVRTAKKDNL